MNKGLIWIVLVVVLVGGVVVAVVMQKKPAAIVTPVPVSSANPVFTPTPTPTAVVVQKISLSISTPKSGVTVSTATLAVNGKTVAGADVSVGDLEVKADASGNFSATVTLDEGENILTVVAVDANGDSAEQELTVTYTPVE